jgi:hypothetical protein
MYSLRDIAAHALPLGAVLPEVVSKTICSDTRNKVSQIHSSISELEKKYLEVFKEYSGILDSIKDDADAFIKEYSHCYTTLHECLDEITNTFKDIYIDLPTDIDEGNEWYAYLEIMNFRIFPTTFESWKYCDERYHDDNIRMNLLVKGILQVISSVPEPEIEVPDVLDDLKYTFDQYKNCIIAFNDYLESRYSCEKVLKKQKEYVESYEARSRAKKPLYIDLDFYKELMNRIVHIPRVLRKYF